MSGRKHRLSGSQRRAQAVPIASEIRETGDVNWCRTVNTGDKTRSQLLRWWGWLLLATVTLLLLVATRYFEVVQLDIRPSSLLFRAAMLVAHFTTLATFALLPALLVSLSGRSPNLRSR